MPVRIRFTKECAGRGVGKCETVVDETLARDWIAAGVAEEIAADVPDRPPKVADEGLTGPGKHRAIRRGAAA